MWINVIKADYPSLNNNVYPEAVLREVALQPAPVYPSYGKPLEEGGFVYAEPQIAQAMAYRFEDGWLQAHIHFFCPHFASMVKDGTRVVRAAAVAKIDSRDAEPGVRRLVVALDRIDHMALCNPQEASWCVVDG